MMQNIKTIVEVNQKLITNICEKYWNIWKLNKRILNNPLVDGEITRKIGTYFELNENENKVHNICM